MKRRQFVEVVAGTAILAKPLAGKTTATPSGGQAIQPGVGQYDAKVGLKSKRPSAKSGPASNTWIRESNKVFDEEVAFQKKFIDSETGILVMRLTSEP